VVEYILTCDWSGLPSLDPLAGPKASWRIASIRWRTPRLAAAAPSRVFRHANSYEREMVWCCSSQSWGSVLRLPGGQLEEQHFRGSCIRATSPAMNCIPGVLLSQIPFRIASVNATTVNEPDTKACRNSRGPSRNRTGDYTHHPVNACKGV
jgi:hypothetical protein